MDSSNYSMDCEFDLNTYIIDMVMISFMNQASL